MRLAMESEGLRTHDIVVATGATESMVHKWARGASRPSPDYLFALADIVHRSARWLVTGEDETGVIPITPTNDIILSDDLERLKDNFEPTTDELAFLQRIQWGPYRPVLQTLITITTALRMTPRR